MSTSSSNQPYFSIGDIVSHFTWGPGQIIGISQDKVTIKFKNDLPHEMNLDLASKALVKLSKDGLIGKLSLNPEALSDLEKTNPLKLVAFALIDLNRNGKPRDIQIKIEGNGLITSKWESWWKKVQPALSKSPYFKPLPNGTYELLVSPEEIPEMVITNPVKKKEAKLTKQQILELSAKVKTKETNFEDIEGSQAKHHVAHELIKLKGDEPQTNELFSLIIRGSARSVGILFQELTKKGRIQDIEFQLSSLIDHVTELSTLCGTDQKGINEHLNAKLNVLRDSIDIALSRDSTKQLNTAKLTFKLTDLILQLTVTDNSNWRSKAIDTIIQIISTLIVNESANLTVFTKKLISSQKDIQLSLDVAKRLVVASPCELKSKTMSQLVAVSLGINPEFSDAFVQNIISKEFQVQWWIDNISDILRSNDSGKSSIHVILGKIAPRMDDQTIGSYLQLIAIILGLSPTKLLPATQDLVIRWARNTPLIPIENQEMKVVNFISLSIQERLMKQQDQWIQTKASLEKDLQDKQNDINGLNETINRMEDTVSELKANYHTPEKWVEYRAKKEILQRLGILYQEISTLLDKEQNNAGLKWISHEVETTMLMNGASLFGDVNSSVVFDPSIHEFIRGTETSDKQVRIRHAGFLWKDPTGNPIVLLRTKVSSQ
jgi:hypothetical protein